MNNYLLLGIEEILNLFSISLIAGGVFLGIIFGAIPGLTAALGVSLLLPFTYTLGPNDGMALLLGIYVGAISGGLVSATLIGIPGTPSSILTVYDALPLAKQGKPREALMIGIISSFIGGMFSAIILIFIAPLLAQITLKFGPWEYFSLSIFGISVIVGVSGDIIKGLITGTLGVFISLFGQDPLFGFPRFSFGYTQLEGGFPLLPVLLGFFAVGQILFDVEEIDNKFEGISIQKEKVFSKVLYIMNKSKSNLLRSSIIGTLIGILPGAGGSIASFLAYDQAKKNSKNPNAFGTGTYEGIVASETANNAVTGGAMIPMITLGIPGDLVTAILLGGLMIHGLRPGPLLFRNSPEVIGSIFFAMILANVFMLFIEASFLRFFAKIIQIPQHIMLPSVFLMTTLGIFSVNNRIFEVAIALLFGVIGYILRKNHYPLPPVVLGYILGPMMEQNYRYAMMSKGGHPSLFFTRPISALLLVIAVMSLIYPMIKNRLKPRAIT